MAGRTFAFWAGPCAAAQVADRLSSAADFRNVRAGTERVYFQMSETWEQAAGPTLMYEAQRIVSALYPLSNFYVYEE